MPANQREIDMSGKRKTSIQDFLGLPDTVPIVDAVIALKVKVKPRDNRYGTPGDPRACALTLAVERETGSRHVAFFRQVAYVANVEGTVIYRYVLNAFEQRQVKRFDEGEDVQLGDFEFRPPQPSRTSAARSKSERERRNGIFRGKKVGPRKAPIRQPMNLRWRPRANEVELG